MIVVELDEGIPLAILLEVIADLVVVVDGGSPYVVALVIEEGQGQGGSRAPEVLIRPCRWAAGHETARAARHDSDWRAGTQYGTRHARLEWRAVHIRSLPCLHIHKSPSPTGLSVQLQTPNFVKLSCGTSHRLRYRRLLLAGIGCLRSLPSPFPLSCSPLQHSILRRDLIRSGSYARSEQIKCFR